MNVATHQEANEKTGEKQGKKEQKNDRMWGVPGVVETLEKADSDLEPSQNRVGNSITMLRRLLIGAEKIIAFVKLISEKNRKETKILQSQEKTLSVSEFRSAKVGSDLEKFRKYCTKALLRFIRIDNQFLSPFKKTNEKHLFLRFLLS